MKIEDSPMNVFSSSAKKKKDSAPSVQKPSLTSSEVSTHLILEKKTSTDREITQMLNRIYAMRGDIDRQLSEMASKFKMTKDEIWKLAQDPKKFSTEKYEALKRQNDEWIKKVLAIEGKPQEYVNQSKEPTSKGRKSKLIGSRRNWISTH